MRSVLLYQQALTIPVIVKRLAVLISTCLALDAPTSCDFDHLTWLESRQSRISFDGFEFVGTSQPTNTIRV